MSSVIALATPREPIMNTVGARLVVEDHLIDRQFGVTNLYASEAITTKGNWEQTTEAALRKASAMVIANSFGEQKFPLDSDNYDQLKLAKGIKLPIFATALPAIPDEIIDQFAIQELPPINVSIGSYYE